VRTSPLSYPLSINISFSEHGKENLDLFFAYLEDWDIERITPVVKDAMDDLDRASSPEDWFEALQKNNVQYNALYECFCSPGLLRSPFLKAAVQRVCRVKGFEIQGPAAALVYFLFQEDKELQSFAEKSWATHGPLVTVSTFENNLMNNLESATRRASEESNPEKLSQFFKGVSIIVRNVGKEVIMKCISGAEKDPIKLAVHRIQPNIPFWQPLLRLFTDLMSKLQRDVWDVISPLTPSGFGDIIFNDRLFGNLLRNIEQGTNGEPQLQDLTGWMSVYIDSIEPLLRPTTAPSLIRQILRTDFPPLSRGLCFKEGMKVLNSTLKAVESDVSSGNVLIRQANDLFTKYQKLVTDVGFSTETFEDKLMEKHMLVAQNAARQTIISALKLDILFLTADFDCLTRKKNPIKPIYKMSLRDDLWNIVSQRFPLYDGAFCIQILEAIKPITEIDKVYISPKDDALRIEKQEFNNRVSQVDKPLASILRSISRCSPNALENVLSDQTSCEVLLGLMMSRSEDVAMSAEDISLTGLKAEDKVDAIRLMLVQDFSIPMLALTALSRQMSKLGHFSMMPRWVKTSMSVLDLLCDRTEGIIRKSDKELWKRSLLRVYWETQWRCLGTIFKRSRRWALYEDKNVMVEFLRDSMDYAETLFDNFWTYEQALRASSEEIKEKSREPSWSDRLLQDASKALNPFTSILSIQDEHLLRTCQQLMCKMLGLLAEKNIELGDEIFFMNLKKYLYPETFPDYDPSKNTPTNLTDVQKTELSVAASRLSPDFVPRGEIGSPQISNQSMLMLV
jgi:senataxin